MLLLLLFLTFYLFFLSRPNLPQLDLIQLMLRLDTVVTWNPPTTKLYSARDKVPFMEIIRQNPLNTSGKSAKTQRQGWGHPHQTYSFLFHSPWPHVGQPASGCGIFRFEYDELENVHEVKGLTELSVRRFRRSRNA